MCSTSDSKIYICTSSTMAITRKESSGIEITEARGDGDVFPCSLPLQEGTSRLEEWRSHEGFPAPRRLTLFSEPHPRRIMALSLWLAFPPLRRWQAPQPLHKLYEGEARAPSQSSTKRSPGHQPSQLGGHPPRVTSSRSLTRKSWWRAQHYTMMQSKNTRGVQILHTQIQPKQQMLGRD